MKIIIPPAALEAGANVVALELYGHPISVVHGNYKDQCRLISRAAFEAMVGAWPGMQIWNDKHAWAYAAATHNIILPLMENPDAEA